MEERKMKQLITAPRARYGIRLSVKMFKNQPSSTTIPALFLYFLRFDDLDQFSLVLLSK